VEVTKSAVEDAIRRIEPAGVASARWFGGMGRAIGSIELAEAFVLPGDGRHVLAVANVVYERAPAEAYLIPLVADAGVLRPAAAGDGTLRALAGAIAEGRTIPALPSVPEGAAEPAQPGPVTAALVCRPASGLRDLEPNGASAVAGLTERPLGMDQSNTSVVLGERLLLKAYRWLQPGLNPDLELVAYLTEEAGFTAVPPLAGYAEIVSRSREPATIALLQAFVADAADAYESLAETLTDWLLAPGSVSVEFATEIAADIGALSAAFHGALASAHGVPGFEPRPATRDELRGWHADARTQLDRALDITSGEAGNVLRKLAPRIAEELTIFEALPTEPLVTRVHGDYHLGQVLAAPDGFRIVDFEGEPTRGLVERRAHRSPLRDVASMLRSFDHVGRSAGRRAEERNGGPVPSPGLDLEAWLSRSRERFLGAYRTGLRQAGAPIEIDPALLRAFEIEKECYEFVYAATYLPGWLWAPTEGMRALMATP
jgi:maltose alpha-D-glucosyltransferase/alpha-amylase